MGGEVEAPSQALSTSSSCLGKTLINGRVLPHLSPLTDKGTLKLSCGVENVALDLTSSGFEVGWDNGIIQVSPVGTPTRTHHEFSAAHSANYASYAAMQSPSKSAYRPKAASFLTFTKGKLGMTEEYMPVRPRTSCDNYSPRHSGGGAPLITSPSARFSRLHCSVDSLHQLMGAPRVPSANLAALAQPRLEAFSLIHSPSGPGGMDPAGVSSSEGGAGQPRPVMANIQLDSAACDAMQPSTSQPRTGTGMGSGRLGTPQRPGSSPSCPGSSLLHSRRRATHPMASFKPTRGHALVVFSDLDKDKNGKVTRAELEDAALALGFQLEQANRLFDKLDKRGKGYLEAADWGQPDCRNVVEFFTQLYMQKFLGLPDVSATHEQVRKYWQTQSTRQVKSLPAAVKLVRINAVTRGANSGAGSGNAIFDAFRFMDTDNSGDLSKEELRDAFFALGVYLSETVVGQIMDVFDHDKNGTVNYLEFLHTMFPSVGRTGRM